MEYRREESPERAKRPCIVLSSRGMILDEQNSIQYVDACFYGFPVDDILRLYSPGEITREIDSSGQGGIVGLVKRFEIFTKL